MKPNYNVIERKESDAYEVTKKALQILNRVPHLLLQLTKEELLAL